MALLIPSKDGRDGKIDAKTDKIQFDTELAILKKYRFKTDMDIIFIFKFQIKSEISHFVPVLY